MKQKSILIVDDDTDITNNLSEIVYTVADKVFTANNGKEAIEVLRKEKVHCIVCDISMPVMDGLETIKTAREMGINSPFIFFTAHGSEELMMEAVKYGAYDFLEKPFTSDLLSTIVEGMNHGFTLSSGKRNNDEHYLSEYREMLERLVKV